MHKEDSVETQNTDYPVPLLYIAGEWRRGGDGVCGEVRNPASGRVLADVPRASLKDLDDALAASSNAFELWRHKSAIERSSVLRKAADLIRERCGALARLMTLEQGKTLAESVTEISGAAEVFDWYSAEALRAYGRIIPARLPGARQMVLQQPLGPVAAFTPWNFPAALPARKIAAALAAGCTVVIKPSEETPASTIGIAQALHDAGLPAGALNVVFGVPAEVSTHLIRSDVIRKIHFTGSTAVGRQLALLAAEGVKPCTLELGGHAPVLVFNDADLEKTVATCIQGKTRNAGQVCTSPTRFIVQEGIHDEFVKRYGDAMDRVAVGSGLDASNQMGALANERRLLAVEELIADAVTKGGRLIAGGKRAQPTGYFLRPTLVVDVPPDAKSMQVEPFGPIALVSRFTTLEQGLAEANKLPFALAAYAFTTSASTAVAVGDELQAGGVAINNFAVSHVEAPFGGMKDSGYGVEGGPEGLSAFMRPKYIHHTT